MKDEATYAKSKTDSMVSICPKTPGWERKKRWQVKEMGLALTSVDLNPCSTWDALCNGMLTSFPLWPFCFLNRSYSSFHEYFGLLKLLLQDPFSFYSFIPGCNTPHAQHAIFTECRDHLAM